MSCGMNESKVGKNRIIYLMGLLIKLNEKMHLKCWAWDLPQSECQGGGGVATLFLLLLSLSWPLNTFLHPAVTRVEMTPRPGPS